MEKITLGHGSGGTLMHDLIDSLLIKKFDNKILREKKDSAILKIGAKKIAFTADSYVVDPIIFPGGDIGKLAVCGTINDLAVCGARPLYISLSLIIEEGLGRSVLEKITGSIKAAARSAGVDVVTGDTKVVGRGACDRIFINTGGIGEIYYDGLDIKRIRIGDAVIVSGPIGEHAVSVLSRREGIGFGTTVKSDSACLNGLIGSALCASKKVRFMRDPTRGGVATTLNEMASGRRFGVAVDESSVPVSGGVRYAGEMLGMDPLYMACEGRVILIVSPEDSAKVLRCVRNDPNGKGAAVIGRITGEHRGKVYLNTSSGGKRIIGMLPGEQLPRIC